MYAFTHIFEVWVATLVDHWPGWLYWPSVSSFLCFLMGRIESSVMTTSSAVGSGDRSIWLSWNIPTTCASCEISAGIDTIKRVYCSSDYTINEKSYSSFECSMGINYCEATSKGFSNALISHKINIKVISKDTDRVWNWWLPNKEWKFFFWKFTSIKANFSLSTCIYICIQQLNVKNICSMLSWSWPKIYTCICSGIFKALAS